MHHWDSNSAPRTKSWDRQRPNLIETKCCPFTEKSKRTTRPKAAEAEKAFLRPNIDFSSNAFVADVASTMTTTATQKRQKLESTQYKFIKSDTIWAWVKHSWGPFLMDTLLTSPPSQCKDETSALKPSDLNRVNNRVLRRNSFQLQRKIEAVTSWSEQLLIQLNLIRPVERQTSNTFDKVTWQTQSKTRKNTSWKKVPAW